MSLFTWDNVLQISLISLNFHVPRHAHILFFMVELMCSFIQRLNFILQRDTGGLEPIQGEGVPGDADRGRTCRFHTERPHPRNSSANHLNTVHHPNWCLYVFFKWQKNTMVSSLKLLNSPCVPFFVFFFFSLYSCYVFDCKDNIDCIAWWISIIVDTFW